ncbi:tryptophan synthase beta subunit-like PLP-dependent enzyme [Phakopsora pachyrhizi]|nr:tryptophan synthase beta subunit-like PLP-dependent enzyme [Phakopsora pachyrhizi]
MLTPIDFSFLRVSLVGVCLLGVLTKTAHIYLPRISSVIRTITDISFKFSGDDDDNYHDNITELIGDTPLIRIKCLSELTGFDILGKCEFLNPGGSVKDRVALKIIQNAEREGKISRNTVPRCRIFEGTSGSTGISLAYIARSLGYEAEIVLPDDTATEKSELMSKMGSTVIKVRPVGIANRLHYVNVARERSRQFELNNINDQSSSTKGSGRSLFVDQFENPLNLIAHYEGTGPEIWKQTKGKIFGFVSGVGTGGTLSGVGGFLRSKDPDVKIIVVDPPGSGVFNKVKEGVMFSETEVEGKRRRHQMDTVVEGIGLNRMTYNFTRSIDLIDDAIKVTDQEAITMSRYIVQKEGLFLGSSSIVNLVGALKFCKKFSNRICILCDGGQRNLSKFWNDDYLIQKGFRIDDHLSFDPISYF